MQTGQGVRALFGLIGLLAGASTGCSSSSAQPGTPGDAAPLDSSPISDAGSTPEGSSFEGGSPTVTIANGQVKGHPEGTVSAFLGIPYAKPPVGPLRWKPPQAPESWASVFDAATYGKRCANAAA